MVYFFTSSVVDPPATIYMGKDKFENEDLIKYGFPEDVWFHVDKLSSAHVYLRLRKGQSWENIDKDLLVDCAQLCKANSIEGNKKDNITILYTPWANLKKQAGMETGQVTFHKDKLVKKIHVETRINAIVNRLMKTRDERYPDLEKEKVERDRGERKLARDEEKKKKDAEQALATERAKAAQIQSYADVFSDEKNLAKTNYEFAENGEAEEKGFQDYEEDFM
ncbi:hypothetical protein DFJ74DRAFT_669309 [Hyaloraphidium curvatum]|nr:hypothetical protein DFJ74DRAFT_669309 [Hyaloraphidium curvatum]